MEMATTENILRCEIRDLLFDLTELDGLSLELQFHGTELREYRCWLNHAIGYTALLEDILAKPRKLPKPVLFESYCDISELRDLTARMRVNFKRIRMAYEKELDSEMADILSIIGLCIQMASEKI